jgi:hypothetical protein
MMPVKLPWFTTKGQIAQLGIALLACIFGGVKAWPDMQKTNLFTLGAILFYLLVGLVVFMIAVLVRNSSARAHTLPAEADRNNKKESSGLASTECGFRAKVNAIPG